MSIKLGNFQKDDFGDSKYELVLIAKILHMYDADMGKALILKAVKALQGTHYTS